MIYRNNNIGGFSIFNDITIPKEKLFGTTNSAGDLYKRDCKMISI